MSTTERLEGYIRGYADGRIDSARAYRDAMGDAADPAIEEAVIGMRIVGGEEDDE